MQKCISAWVGNRIEEIGQALCKENGSYALVVENSKILYARIDPIIQTNDEITLSAGDCKDLREYFEQSFEASAIMQQELYRQGCLDCVKLLLMLGLLAGKEEIL